MTSNGDLVNKILRAGNNHEKEYLVTVDKPISKAFIDGMSGGVPILGTVTKKCRVSQESRCVFRIVLVQGLNRQIRRMAEHFGFDVTRLERQRIMNINLGNLPVGQWRDLTSKELAVLMNSIRDSSSDAPAASQKPAGKKRPVNAPVQKRESHKSRSDNKPPARPSTKSAGKPGGRTDNGPGSQPAARPKLKPKKQRQRSTKR
jgi:23S rRNA pseudouridine2604 synthase